MITKPAQVLFKFIVFLPHAEQNYKYILIMNYNFYYIINFAHRACSKVLNLKKLGRGCNFSINTKYNQNYNFKIEVESTLGAGSTFTVFFKD